MYCHSLMILENQPHSTSFIIKRNLIPDFSKISFITTLVQGSGNSVHLFNYVHRLGLISKLSPFKKLDFGTDHS